VDIKRFLASAWNHRAIRFARAVIVDLWMSAWILLSLEAIWWGLKRMELAGYPADLLTYFEKIHFCSSISAFSLLSVAFVFKLAVGLYKERANG
jgi:hypothetical protein